MNANIPSGKWPKIPPERLRYITLGIEFITLFMIFLGAGFLLDRRFDTSPGFTVFGMIVGFAVAMYWILRVARGTDWGRKGPPDVEDD